MGGIAQGGSVPFLLVFGQGLQRRQRLLAVALRFIPLKKKKTALSPLGRSVDFLRAHSAPRP